MREEFLPIGTVVKLYGQSGMIMIIGLSSRHSANESHGYIGCSYPDGFTTVDHLVMFDYKQIETIHYYTLADKKKEITTSTSTDNLQKINIPTSTINKIEFDENGVVISVAESNEKVNTPVATAIKEQASNDIKPQQPVIIEAINKNVANDIKFDENGVVIGQAEVNNEVHSTESTPVKEENTVEPPTPVEIKNVDFNEIFK